MEEEAIKQMIGQIAIINVWILMIALAVAREEIKRDYMKNLKKDEKEK